MLLQYYLKTWPERIKRLIKHFIFVFDKKRKNPLPPHSILGWLMECACYIIDIFAIPEIYQFFSSFIKPNTRSLNEAEINLAKSIFKDTLDLSLIRIDNKSLIGTKNVALAYVTFHIINFKDVISQPILIHELVHVWQYQKFGSVYLSKAFFAQLQPDTYEYGGIEGLYNAMVKGKLFLDFTVEQQAEIIEDYFRSLQHNNLERPIERGVYHYYWNQLFE